MKAELINEKTKTTGLEYPVLMHASNGKVILFVNETSGTVIVAGGVSNVGDYDTEWASANDASVWAKVTGSVILEND